MSDKIAMRGTALIAVLEHLIQSINAGWGEPLPNLCVVIIAGLRNFSDIVIG